MSGRSSVRHWRRLLQVHAALQACNLSSARAAARAEGFLQLIVGSRDFAIWQAKIDKESALLYDGLVSQDLRGHASDRLREDYADVEVPVEASFGGADYRDSFMEKQTGGKQFQADVPVPLSMLLDHIEEREQSCQRDESSQLTLYLAQKDIRDHLPQLALDIKQLPVKDASDRLFQQSIWLGPKGTRTPLHCDPYHNQLCQIWGKKRVRIYSAEEVDRLYPHSNPVLRNTSQITSTDAVDTAKFPRFTSAPFQECVLEPGHILFMPKRCWHEVTALTGSLSISFWST